MEEVVEKRSAGQKVADAIVTTLGSWRFIIIQSALLVLWIILNGIAWISHWDPYPFIALNLLLSCQAAFATPMVMMSQNRQAEKDRAMAEQDLKSDLKSESILTHVEQILTHVEEQEQVLYTNLGIIIDTLARQDMLHEADQAILKEIKQLAEIRRRRSPSHKIHERTPAAS